MARRYVRDAQGRFASKGGTIRAKTKNKISSSPRRLTKDERIARDVMTDKRFRSDRQRINEMIKRGVNSKSDFVKLVADVRSKQGVGTTGKIKPKR
jgi:hypothetical protein